MFDVARALVLVLSAALASGGAILAAGLLGPPEGTGVGADFGLDTNGNGKYDWLIVDADVHLPEAGLWDISGGLSSNAAPPGGPCGFGFLRAEPGFQTVYPIAYVYERYFFEAGDRSVRLAFPGTDIFRSGADGPYEVVASFSLGGGIVYYDPGILPPEHEPPYILWNYTTAAYRASDFEEPPRPAYFTGEHSGRGVHADEDGLYDLLELSAGVRVNTPGMYGLNGLLMSRTGSDPNSVATIAYAYRDIRLDTRDTSVTLRFRGDQIRNAGVDGPWEFALTLYSYAPYADGRNGTGGINILSHPVAVYPEALCGSTGSYPASDFDDTPELVRFTGAFEEQAVDWDGDGLYEGLLIRAEIEAYVASAFDLAGVLRSGDGATEIVRSDGQAWLPEGVAWTDWRFSGAAIRASGIDGPYEAVLSMTPSLAVDPTTSYRTRAYRATDFEGEDSTQPSYWISNLNASAVDGSTLEIFVDVQRGRDLLTYVIEDTLTVAVYDGDRTEWFRAASAVYLPSGGASQSFAFKAAGLAPGTYTVVAILGPESQPVDVRVVTVTL